MAFNYQEICSELLSDLPEKQKKVILRRFGLESGKRETLEAIGRDLGVTRERVRQIEKGGVLKIAPELKKYQKVLQSFQDQLKATGGLRKEDVLLSQLGGEKHGPHIFFLLTLAEPFLRFGETEEFHSFWTINPKAFDAAKRVINSFYQKLTSLKQPLKISEWKPSFAVSPRFLEYFLEISKIIQKSPEGLFGLKDWPEINPKSIKDKAFLVLKKAGQPLHFRDVASLIEPTALFQTVHNELIRDPRFVLVGRGLYALKDWGFQEGDVKDVICHILKKEGRPLTREEVLEKVFKQRLVKRNTILLNLSNKKHFLRTPEGKYIIQES